MNKNEIKKKAYQLANEAWRMLPDSCKNIMGEKLKKTFISSLKADIEYEFTTKNNQQ